MLRTPRLGTRSRVAVLLAAYVAGAALANEVVVRNDSFENGDSVYIVGNFVAGEHAGVRLTSPCSGTIVALQIGWLSIDPSAEATIEQAIHVYLDDGSFPSPGTEVLTLDSPLLTPGFLNEFRYVDEGNQTPISIPVTANQKFYVTLEYANSTHIENGDPSIFRDVTGCQAGKNVLYAIPGGWMNFCIYLQGDVVIRAIVDCGAVTGACCLPDGSCQTLSPASCSSQGGTYKGDFVNCSDVNCTPPTGACCLVDGTCQVMTPAQCGSAGGTYQGDNVQCGDVQCPTPKGACCFPATGGCLNNFTKVNCENAGGIWKGPNTKCADVICFPKGACCLPDGSCIDNVSPETCAAQSGVFQGNGTTCANTNCPEPEGACCFSGNFCIPLTEADCAIAGGTWGGILTTCDDLNGNGVPDGCEPPATCKPCDTNCDGSINAFDIEPFRQALLGNPVYCSPCAFDTNTDGSINAFDIQGFRDCLNNP